MKYSRALGRHAFGLPVKSSAVPAATFGQVALMSFNEYRDSRSDFFDVSVVSGDAHNVQFSATNWDTIGSANITEFSGDPMMVRRTATLIKHNPSNALRVALCFSGSVVGVCGNKPVSIKPGAVHFLDFDRPSITTTSSLNMLGLFLPYAAIGYDPRRHAPSWSVGLNTPIGRLMKTAMISVQSEIKSADADQIEKLVSGLEGIFTGVLRGGLHSFEDQGVQAARACAMRDHLDASLGKPDLGIDTLMQAFGASRATIFRDFADEGGVERYITKRRLERAYSELSERPKTRGIVMCVADKWGFTSPSHFSRLFLDRFGCRPGEVVGMRCCTVDEKAVMTESLIPTG